MKEKQTRARYTLEFKLEAVRLVNNGQSVGVMAKVLGVPKATLSNWVREAAKGALQGAGDKVVTPEQMEIARLRAELARVKTERDILEIHSDRGSQYCSHEFQHVLRGYGMRSSMSRKGNCWDNAPTESLWSRLKVGSLHGRRFATQRQAMDEVVAWLTFYNYRRLHSSLGYLSPMQYEQRWPVLHYLADVDSVLKGLACFLLGTPAVLP